MNGPSTPLTGEAFSTLLLTALLGVGLFFFLRAAGKDRRETRLYVSNRSLDSLGSALRSYLQGRAYRLQSTDAEGVATFAGEIKASLGLAVFLTLLAAVGLGCFALVVQMLAPQWGGWPWLLVLASPWAGWYYRQRNQGPEQIRLKLQEEGSGVRLWVEGHRDELDRLAATFALEERDPAEEG